MGDNSLQMKLSTNRVEAEGDSPKNKDTKTQKDPEKEKEPTVPWLQLLSTADTVDKLLMAAGILGALGNGISWPIFAIIFADFTDAFGGNSDDFMGDVKRIAALFVYLAIGSSVAALLQASMWMWAGSRQTSRLRKFYLNSVLRQNISYFDVEKTTGSLLQGLNEDSSTVQQAISEKVGHFAQHMTTFIAGIIIAFVGGWDMALVMVGTMPFLAIVGAILAKVTAIMSAKSQEAYTQASSIAQQALAQVRTVAAYGGEERTLTAYTSALDGPIALGIRQSLYTGLALGGVNAIMYWTYAVAFFYGAWRVKEGEYSGGQVMQVFVAALIGGFSLGQAMPVLEQFSKGCVAGGRMFAVINRKPVIDPEDESGQELKQVTGTVQLRDVVFAYPARPDVRVFNGLSLTVPAGKTLALVGSSGSGKSTVVQLIERFYDPESGSVLLDGVDIRTLKVKWLRSQVGLVSQEPTLFATTIFENIAMGKEGASQEEVEAAAVAANAHHFISHLPDTYNTQVGERGLQLSGGQKQRIAIARAILKNPRILLLDEATSALDTESERIVQEALNRMIVGRTTVVVAHRLSTIQGADIIAVVRQGEVVEQGSHEQLIANPEGAYTTLVKLQLAADAERGLGGGSDHGLEDVDEEALEADYEAEEEDMAEEVAANLSKAPSAEPTGPLSNRGSGALKQGRLHSIDIEKGGKRASGELVTAGKRSSGELVVKVQPRGSSDAAGKGGEGSKGKDKKKEDEVDVPFSRLMALNKPELVYGFFGVLASAAAGAVQPAFAFIISSFVVVFYEPDADSIMSQASFWSWMFFVVGVGVLVVTTVQQLCFGKMGLELARRVRTLMMRSMLHQEIGWFDRDENSSGVLTSKLATEAAHIRGAVGDTIGLMLQNVLCLAFGYAISFAFDWRMSLVITGALPFMIFGSIIYYKTVTGMESGSDAMFASANQAVSDAFASIRVVQAYNLQKQITGLYKRLVASANQKMKRQSFLTGALMGYSQFSIFAVYGLIIFFGGVEVDSGRTDFDGMLKAFLAILLAAMGIAQAQIGFPDIGKAKQAVRTVFPIIDRKSTIDASSPAGSTTTPAGDTAAQGAIELSSVKFAYPARPSVIVFRSFSLSIPAGTSCALVGESGSGKSTIVGLVLRFYDVLEGAVTLDGQDVRQYNLRWLRAQMGLVSQEPLLFSATVADNIRYGRPDASMEEVEAAARAANAHDFIMALPEGYNTQVGERGVQLSGGQKQRVAIARAVVKNPRVLLLDEATSALDAASEKVVQEALDTIMVGRTSIVVAHRLSTIRNAHKIALVYRGSILEQGTHAELMALPDGGYSRLVHAQMGPDARAQSMARSQSKARLARNPSSVREGKSLTSPQASKSSDPATPK